MSILVIPSDKELQLKYLQYLAQDIYDTSLDIEELKIDEDPSGFRVSVKYSKSNSIEIIMDYREMVIFLKGLEIATDASCYRDEDYK